MKKHAFSLVELSIVLIIIGLLIAGVSGGSKLIQNARLQHLITETQEFKSNIATFYLTYSGYPGDFKEAYDFFGSVNSCTDVDVNTNAAGCNGDGDKIIEWSRESYRSYQHLESAELIKGNFNGTSTRYYSSYKKYEYHPPIECSTMGHTDMGTHCHQLGSTDNGNSPGFTPRELYRIDKKLDDSMPKTGHIRFRNFALYGVDDTTCGNTNGYHLDLAVGGCNFLYTIDVVN